jgi:hypothetical protein
MAKVHNIYDNYANSSVYRDHFSILIRKFTGVWLVSVVAGDTLFLLTYAYREV